MTYRDRYETGASNLSTVLLQDKATSCEVNHFWIHLALSDNPRISLTKVSPLGISLVLNSSRADADEVTIATQARLPESDRRDTAVWR